MLTKTVSASTITELKTNWKTYKAWVLSDRENSCHIPTKCGLSADDIRCLDYLGIRFFLCHKPLCEQSWGLRHQTWLGSQTLKIKVLLATKQHIYKNFQYRKTSENQSKRYIVSLFLRSESRVLGVKRLLEVVDKVLKTAHLI